MVLNISDDYTIEDHYKELIEAIENDELTFFLGAGANQCEREPGERWAEQSEFLPNANELADYLAEKAEIPNFLRRTPCKDCERTPPLVEDRCSLSKIAEYITINKGRACLHRHLREVFDKDYPPTILHGFIAGLPETLRKLGCSTNTYQVIVTTNYDDLMEKAFHDQEVDILTFMTLAPDRVRKFVHRLPTGELCPVAKANEYTRISLKDRPAIVKIHGAVDRQDKTNDSYVISESDYLDYLAGPDIANILPQNILTRLTNSSFLFLGYSLNDWNLRVFLHKIFVGQNLKYKSWAVQLGADPYMKKFLEKLGIYLIDMPLRAYILGFQDWLEKSRHKEAV